MNKLIVANWKANISLQKVDEWLDGFLSVYKQTNGIEVVLAIPCLSIARTRQRLQGRSGLSIATQNISPFPEGSYTGATPAAWLKGVADYALIGHREQRQYFHISVQEAANQVSEAVSAGLEPILCLEEKIAAPQIAALSSKDLAKVFLAYTPADAEKLEIARSLDTIIGAVEYISSLSAKRPVLYGGGVQLDNAREIMAIPNIAGILVGRGCIDPKSFADLVDNCAKNLY